MNQQFKPHISEFKREEVEEIKEEFKQSEGDQNVKSRIRTLQIQMARKRMMASVPKADVIITNPTHIAVAIEYKRENMGAPKVIAKGAGLIAERIKEIAGTHQLDMNRLAQEIAVMVERMDITEEIVRVGSHITQLRERLDNGSVVGRSIDFLLQEVNREVNTIASKASDVKIAQIVVDMKTEIERVREQIQNIE